MHSCQRLRQFNRYFDFEPQKLGMTDTTQMVLKYETHPMLENFPFNYLPDEFSSDPEQDTKKQKEVFKFLNTTDHQVTDYSGIPSSSTLLTAESAPIEDMRIFK